MTSGQHLASNAKLHLARLTGGSWKKSPHKSNLQRDWTGMYVGHKYEYVSREKQIMCHSKCIIYQELTASPQSWTCNSEPSARQS